MTLNEREMRQYRALRCEGKVASHAHFIVKEMRDAGAVLTPEWTSRIKDLAPYGRDLMAAYTVDRHELAERAGVAIPDGVEVLAFVHHDGDAHPSDSECYDADDLDAWKRDAWHFVGVAIVAVRADGAVGESALWGIEQGDYWPGTDESDIWHAVPDQINEALRELERTPPTDKAKVALIADALPDAEDDLDYDALYAVIDEVRDIVAA